MRAVLDTNILCSSILTSGGMPDRLYRAWREGRFQLLTREGRWTGGYIFENEWQSFRARQNRALELVTAPHTYERPGRSGRCLKK